jgi:acyl dehydratase
MVAALSFATLENHIGRIIALTDWLTVGQDEVDAFAAITDDRDPMHVDPDWARNESPYGQTVLAGFHMLALLPRLTRGFGLKIDGVHIAMNYGFNRIRFVGPLPVGAPFRNRVELLSVDRRPDGKASIVTCNSYEIRGQERPALVADWVNILWPAKAHAD